VGILNSLSLIERLEEDFASKGTELFMTSTHGG
jgi:hypothetical protein